MKLLSVPTSPFSARVRIQALEKDLELNVVYPSQGQTIGEHADVNPFRRVPVLVTESGFLIESTAIQEYLEDRYPVPPLRPADAFTAARMRAFIQAVDLYLFPPVRALRGMRRGAKELPEAMTALDEVLDALQKLMDQDGYVCSGALTLADVTLVPAVFYLQRFLAGFGEASALARHPLLERWWDTVARHDSVARVTAELERANRAAGR